MRAEIRWHAGIDDVEAHTDFHFLSLGGGDGPHDRINLVKQRHDGMIDGRIGRIEREFGQKRLARTA